MRYLRRYEKLKYNGDIVNKLKTISKVLTNMYGIKIIIYINTTKNIDLTIFVNTILLTFYKGGGYIGNEKAIQVGTELIKLFDINKEDISQEALWYKVEIEPEWLQKNIDKFETMIDSEELGLL